MASGCDVLIVGAGPTGLMMACQLQQHGISFRIIDRQADRAHESRAFGIQAKSMEIFQNLGLAGEFLARAEARAKGIFFYEGKKRAEADLNVLEDFGTPFPRLYFLPQSDTEQILGDHLVKNGAVVERRVELVGFDEKRDGVACELVNHASGHRETLVCKYIIGCDGAHSFVRDHLGIAFEGAPYEQQFILADTDIEWPYGLDNFMFFFGKAGLVLHIRLNKKYSRLLGAKFSDASTENPPPLSEMADLIQSVTHQPVRLFNDIWRSRFHLYHRAVTHYRKGRAFLAGDAAHIHTPVGAQGMNTGLQDATNLAWKLAYVLKGLSIDALLNTYHSERQRIGAILLKTTDRAFGFVTARGWLASRLRNFLLPLFFIFVFKLRCLRKYLFHFMSQLAIHYHTSAFVTEKTALADKGFLDAPKAGCRAPDARLEQDTLFELLKGPTSHVLMLGIAPSPEMKRLQGLYQSVVQFHDFRKSQAPELFQRYGVSSAAYYFIRPDGYIGFRSFGSELRPLKEYLEKLLPGC